MISIVCASNNEKVLKENLLNSLRKQTYKDYELIVVDTNKIKFKSAAEALNYGGNKARGEYIIFLHHDIVMRDEFELKKLVDYVDKIKDFGIIGVAGITSNGRIVGNITNGIPEVKISKKMIEIPTEVQTLDEVMFIVKKEFFNIFKISEENKTWHLYAVEYSILAKKNNKNVYVIPSNIYHKSAGTSMNSSYYEEIKRFSMLNRDIKVINTTMGIWHTHKMFLKLDILKNKLLIELSKKKKKFPLK